MEIAVSDQKRQLISSFLEIAIDQTMETAIQFLNATNWKLEKAINLFLNQRSNQTRYKSSMNHNSVTVHPNEIWNLTSEPSNSSSNSELSSLYCPPSNLLFNGSFEEAKATSSKKDRWLLVNLQSITEFASHMLNRDLWSNDTVSETIRSSFILLQVYNHTDEGKKISTFYKIDSNPPVVLLIDPITGQKMHKWTGLIDVQSFLDNSMRYIDFGPQEHISIKRIKTEKNCFASNHTDQDMSTLGGNEFEDSVEAKTVIPYEKEDTLMSDRVVIPLEKEFKQAMNLEVACLSDGVLSPCEEETCLSSDLFEFPVLTEEPKGDYDPSLVWNICVRFPDGRRKQRKFLKSEPIQLLWSFCYSHMKKSEKKAFKLVYAIPGTSKTLDYEANVTFDQSGLANSIIMVTWD